MTGLALNLDSFNKIDDEIKSQFLEQANEAGLSPTLFLKSLLHKFIANEEVELKFNEKTLRAIEELEQGLGHSFEAGSVEEFMAEMEKIANE